MRGNRRPADQHPPVTGSIPARAGEPRKASERALWDTVYPRACGGTEPTAFVVLALHGLSPRVRGNPLRCCIDPIGNRSIPARAGEPAWLRCSAARMRVYPRACGGTCLTLALKATRTGLSPRVRGNPSVPEAVVMRWRSIPARAGEPPRAVTHQPNTRVYPRACGGTSRTALRRVTRTGLSPRVRGNQPEPRPRHRFPRSIPARAGEPRIDRPGTGDHRVYPRACGGT